MMGTAILSQLLKQLVSRVACAKRSQSLVAVLNSPMEEEGIF